jgi:hypothetical protein
MERRVFSAEAVKKICQEGTQTNFWCTVPLTINGTLVVFKISYWFDRDAFVAEPGNLADSVWRPAITYTHPALLAHIKDFFSEKFSVSNVAGIVSHDHVSIVDSIAPKLISK